MVNDAIRCERVWQEISNYLEGDVEPGLRAAMDEHFKSCKKCVSVLEGTRNVIRLYSDERMIEVPAGFGQRLERRLAQNRRGRNIGWSTWSAWLVPVAALLLIGGGIRVANSLSAPRPILSEHANPGKNVPPDMLVVVSAGAKDFHVPGCPFIHNKNEERTLTAKEAMREGYVPCVRCMRKYLETANAGRISLEQEAQSDLDADNEAVTGAR